LKASNMNVKRRVMVYAISVASVYVSMNLMTKFFIDMLSNFTLTVV